MQCVLSKMRFHMNGTKAIRILTQSLGGPFEYWLRRSHSQNVGDGSVIDQCVQGLRAGQMPPVLRELSRAASRFPEDWHG